MVSLRVDRKTEKHILNILRQGTITWHLTNEVRKKFRKRVNTRTSKTGKQLQRWEIECQSCGELFPPDEIHIDHIQEVGPFKGDWSEYVQRMFCSIENLQPLCVSCHMKKTKSYAMERIYKRRRNDPSDQEIL